MTDKISLSNMALSLCRADTITSFEDETEEARNISLFYNQTYLFLLSLNDFSYTSAKEVLNRTNEKPVNAYSYQHYLPIDLLRLWAVYNEDSDTALPIQDYEVISPTGSKRINSNSSTIVVEYNKEINEYQLPPDFIQLFIYALASNICLPLTEDKVLQQQLRQIAFGTPSEGGKGGLFKQATTNDNQQQPIKPIRASILSDARFSGRGGRRYRR